MSTLVPRPRLLLAVSCGLLPLALGSGFAPGAAPLAALGALLLGALAVLDAILAGFRPAWLAAELPAVVRLTKDRPGELPLVLRADPPPRGPRPLRLALVLPPETDAPGSEERRAAVPARAARLPLPWPCLPRRRGRFLLEALHVEEASPLGLWGRRRALPLRCELRVYPDLAADRRQVAALFLERGAAVGVHSRRQVGRGREFEKLRDYVPGDSLEEISWKATARRLRPISKVYQIERTQEVYVLIDHSRLSARPAPRTGDAPEVRLSTLERYLTSALLLGRAAERQGDLFGLVTFSDQVDTFLRARNGEAHFQACRDAIHALEPSLVNPDFDELVVALRSRLRRRALLVVLTALDDPLLAESFTRQIGFVSRQHLILVNMLRPPEVRPLFEDREPGGGPAAAGADDVRSTDDVYRRLGGHLLWRRLRESENRLRRLGVRFNLLEREQLTAQLLSHYLEVKRRQIL